MAAFFSKEIKINADDYVVIEARRYKPAASRWSVDCKSISRFHPATSFGNLSADGVRNIMAQIMA